MQYFHFLCIWYRFLLSHVFGQIFCTFATRWHYCAMFAGFFTCITCRNITWWSGSQSENQPLPTKGSWTLWSHSKLTSVFRFRWSVIFTEQVLTLPNYCVSNTKVYYDQKRLNPSIKDIIKGFSSSWKQKHLFIFTCRSRKCGNLSFITEVTPE